MSRVKTDELRAEYSREVFSTGVRGKHLAAYKKGTNLVLLSPDVAEAFPTDKDVNDALRSLLELAQKTVVHKKPASRRTRKAS